MSNVEDSMQSFQNCDVPVYESINPVSIGHIVSMCHTVSHTGFELVADAWSVMLVTRSGSHSSYICMCHDISENIASHEYTHLHECVELKRFNQGTSDPSHSCNVLQ